MRRFRAGLAAVPIALGFGQLLAWGSTYYLPAVIAVPVAEALGLSTMTFHVAFSLALATMALLGPVVGRVIDRRGGRSMLACANLIMALGLVLLASSSGANSLRLAWIVLGVGMAMGLYEAAFASVARSAGERARTSIVVISLIAGFASTVCWPLTALVEQHHGWRAVCWMWAAIHVLVVLPSNLWALRAESSGPTTPAPVAKGACRWNLAMALVAMVALTAWFTSTSMAVHLPTLLQLTGVGALTAIAIAGLIGPAQVAGRLLEFTLLRKVHPLLSAGAAAVCLPLGALLLLIQGPSAAAAFTVLHGLGNGVLTIAAGTLPLIVFGAAGYGQRLGRIMVPARTAQAAAPFLYAAVVDRFGAYALVFSSVLCLLALAALTGLLVLLKRKPVDASPTV